MNRALSFFGSSIGKKVIMATTGVILLGFVVVHMMGNLQIYLGPEALDHYAVTLRKVPALLWTARLVLLVAAVLHVWASWSTTIASWKARPRGYRTLAHRESTVSSRTMRWTGVALLLFVVYHLLDLTLGVANPAFVEGQVFHNVVVSFQRAGVAAVYGVAMIALGLHLYHGIWSFMQTLGLNHPRYNRLRYALAAVLAIALVLGNLSFPLAVELGFVQERPQAAWLGGR